MLLILIIDFIVVGTLITVTVRRGFEESLPFFVFFTVLLPDESRLRLLGTVDLYTHRIALATLLVLYLFTRRRSPRRPMPLKTLILLHVAWALFSTLYSIVFVTSLKQLLAQLLEYYLLYFILFRTITSGRTIVRISLAIIAAMAVCSVFGLLEIYASWSVLSIFPPDLQLTYGSANMLYADLYDRGVRARSTFPHPILFGGALAMTIPLALHASTTLGQRGLRKLLLNTSVLVMFWSLYKTGSRGPWLACAFTLTILAVAAAHPIRKRVLQIAILAAAVLLIRPGVGETLLNIYRATLDSDSQMGSSFNYRPALFRTVSATLNDHPSRALLGYGLGSFRDKGLIIEMQGQPTRRWYTCDSTWILFWYESGYIGLLLLALLLFRPAMLAYRGFRRLPPPQRGFSLILLASMLAFYIVMMSVAMYGWGQNGYMLWIIIATSISYIALTQDELRNPALPGSTAAVRFVPMVADIDRPRPHKQAVSNAK